MTALLAAVDALNVRLLAADAIARALYEASNVGEPAAWVTVFRDQVESIQQAAEAVEQLARKGGAL